MLSLEEMPDNNEDLAKIDVDFPPIPDADTVDPDSFSPQLLDYLELEEFTPDGELTFLRTALVETTSYWIWEFTSDGEKAYVTFAKDDHGSCVGCETDYYSLTPEQYMLGDYHNCF